MIASVQHGDLSYQIDLSKPLDISIALKHGQGSVNAWYQPPPSIQPVKDSDFIGSVAHGAPVNFNEVTFNPHSHVTHTECLGHITEEVFSVNKKLKTYFMWAELVSIAPEKVEGDFVVSSEQLKTARKNQGARALIIRTLPNTNMKRTIDYAHKNPPYLSKEAMEYIVAEGIEHLLVDLPSVDKEKDGGKLEAHKTFWKVNQSPRTSATITEFVFVPGAIDDGLYWLNLQVAPFENDAAPSRPVLFKPTEI
ncbi:MAG: cyclase family protein [Bacteroidota bacterium]